jgi:hypothetical protein
MSISTWVRKHLIRELQQKECMMMLRAVRDVLMASTLHARSESCGDTSQPLWMPVTLSATTPASLHECGVSGRALNLMEGILSTHYKCTLNSQMKCFRTRVDMDFFLVLVCGSRARSLSAPFTHTLYIQVIHRQCNAKVWSKPNGRSKVLSEHTDVQETGSKWIYTPFYNI